MQFLSRLLSRFTGVFTAVKRKHPTVFQSRKFESLQTFTRVKFIRKRCRKCLDKPNFAPIKLVDDRNGVKFVFIFLCKIMAV